MGQRRQATETTTQSVSSGSEIVRMISTVDRAEMWSLHEKRLPNGTYGVDPSEIKTTKVVKKFGSILIINSDLYYT